MSSVSASVAPSSPATRQVDIGIDGMTCASCVARVERALRKVPGVDDATVNLATETARVTLHDAPDTAPSVSAQKADANGADTDRASDATATGQVPAALLRAIRNAGYTPRAQAGMAPARDERVLGVPRAFAPVLAGLLLCAPLVLPMLAAPFIGSERAHALVPVWLQAVLGTLVQFTLGLSFYRAAWHAVRQRSGNMELLVAIGTTAAWALSLWLWWRHAAAVPGAGHGSHAAATAPHVYFESAAVVIVLVRLGKWLEQRAKRQTTQAIWALQALRPDIAHWLPPRGPEQDVPVAELMPGDTIVLRPGERVPADGVVLQGNSQIDASMLTGEPLPVDVSADSPVTGGTLNGSGVLHVRVTHAANAGVLAHIIRLVEDAQAAKPPIQKLVDQIAAVFVPIVLVVAAATLLGWLAVGLPAETAILRAVAVLVIACPCALGLATPVAIMAGTGVAARHGILIKDGAALERARQIQLVAFDKTGTLTAGRPVLAALQPVSATPGQADDGHQALLGVAAALQGGSEHPLARAVLQAAQERAAAGSAADAVEAPTAHDVQSVPGRGIEGVIAGRHWYLGSGRWMRELGAQPATADAVPTGAPFADAGLAKTGSDTPARIAPESGPDAVPPPALTEVESLEARTQVQPTGEELKAAPAAKSSVSPADGNITSHDGAASSGAASPPSAEAATTEAARAFVVHWRGQGATLSALAERLPAGGVALRAWMAFSDPVKPEAEAAVRALQAQGIGTVLISGDQRDAALAVAQQVGIAADDVLAEVLPADKAAAIERLQRRGQADARVVAMVGDGINDAPALAAADVGMAMANPGGGTDVALHAADITLMRGDVRLVPEAIAVSRATVRKIRQNLFWAFGYNVVGIPLAAWGLLSPMLAGTIMALSSVSVVTNALLLRRWRPGR